MKILVTGCAGFIGYHLCWQLLQNKRIKVYGVDNLNSYYDVNLKKERLRNLKKMNSFKFFKLDIAKKTILKKNFVTNKYDVVINLAAQAGVRHSIENPDSYVQSNLLGFFNVLDCSRISKISHFIFASTSSVYGNAKTFPIKEDLNTDKPLSFYAATKKSNEVLAYSYSNIYKLPCTGLRFFTVYGPLGRPDMSLFKFTKNIKENKKIDVFNYGKHSRDFTYVDDLVSCIVKLLKKPSKSKIPYSIFNVASNSPSKLIEFIKIIEKKLNLKAKINFLPLQKGDVPNTWGSITNINKIIKFKPKTSLNKGVSNFINWYNEYYSKK